MPLSTDGQSVKTATRHLGLQGRSVLCRAHPQVRRNVAAKTADDGKDFHGHRDVTCDGREFGFAIPKATEVPRTVPTVMSRK